jgi:hypothetical protein
MRCLIGGQAEAVQSPVSDRRCQPCESCGDSERASCFGGDVVEAAAKVLHERGPGDDHLSGAVGAQSSHGLEAVFDTAVVGFYARAGQ